MHPGHGAAAAARSKERALLTWLGLGLGLGCSDTVERERALLTVGASVEADAALRAILAQWDGGGVLLHAIVQT